MSAEALHKLQHMSIKVNISHVKAFGLFYEVKYFVSTVITFDKKLNL
jgi:hypothetical protein